MLSDNWVVQNLENALETWNSKLAEIWQLITQSPQQFKGIEYGVALHAVILCQIVVVAQALDNRRFIENMGFSLFQRVDIALAFFHLFCPPFSL